MFKNYLCEFRGHRRAIYKSSLLYFAVLKTVRVLWFAIGQTAFPKIGKISNFSHKTPLIPHFAFAAESGRAFKIR